MPNLCLDLERSHPRLMSPSQETLLLARQEKVSSLPSSWCIEDPAWCHHELKITLTNLHALEFGHQLPEVEVLASVLELDQRAPLIMADVLFDWAYGKWFTKKDPELIHKG